MTTPDSPDFLKKCFTPESNKVFREWKKEVLNNSMTTP